MHDVQCRCSGQVKLATGLQRFHTFGNLKCFY